MSSNKIFFPLKSFFGDQEGPPIRHRINMLARNKSVSYLIDTISLYKNYSYQLTYYDYYTWSISIFSRDSSNHRIAELIPMRYSFIFLIIILDRGKRGTPACNTGKQAIEDPITSYTISNSSHPSQVKSMPDPGNTFVGCQYPLDFVIFKDDLKWGIHLIILAQI
jgi:hypothetical protein